MVSSIKPIKVWGQGGPNPPKVAMILEELGVPYEAVAIDFADLKKPDYLAINPNGRIPAIQDPNTNITLWESGAIVEYLIERYDTEHKLSFTPGSPEYYHAKQWLFFQVSGQGPYYGQSVWFKKYHPEQLPSAIDRYVNEVKRVSGVLEAHLAKQKEQYGGKGDGPWLVGNKISYADISFIPWQVVAGLFHSGEGHYRAEDFPLVTEWLNKLKSRPGVSKVKIAGGK